jgi:hypothetical protein
MINLLNLRNYCNGDITKVINYKKAIKDDKLYEVHHCDEIINKLTGLPFYSVEELEKADAKNIKYTSSKQLQGGKKYWKTEPEKLMCLVQQEHRHFHKVARAKLLELTNFKNEYVNGRKKRCSTVGVAKLIREHYAPKKLTREEIEKERRFYNWNRHFSWETPKEKPKICRKQNKSVKNKKCEIMKNTYIKKYKLNPEKFNNFLNKNKAMYSSLYNKFVNKNEIYWETIEKEYERIQKLKKKLQ